MKIPDQTVKEHPSGESVVKRTRNTHDVQEICNVSTTDYDCAAWNFCQVDRHQLTKCTEAYTYDPFVSVGHLITNTMYHRLTVTSIITEPRTILRVQLSIKTYRLTRNRMVVILGFDFHIASTSKGNVMRYSYAYQAKLDISNAKGNINHRLTQCCEAYIIA